MKKSKFVKKAVPALLAMSLMFTASSKAMAADTVQDVTTNNSASVDVQAKIATQESLVYKVDIEWGKMEFVYSGSKTWNPDTHTSAGAAGWNTTATYYGTNNEITVANHSNAQVKVNYGYSKSGVAGFNTVEGSFFATQDLAIGAATKGSAEDSDKTKESTLDRALEGSAVTNAPKATVYFSPYGTPDTGASTSFTKIGQITLTIAQP